MEGRKLTLVPYKRWMEYHRWQEQQTPHLPPNPHLTELSQVQHQLQSLTDRHDLSETEKSIKYGQLLQRLQLFHQKALDETAPPTLKDLKALLQHMPLPPPTPLAPPPPPPPPVTPRSDPSLPGVTTKATQEGHEEEETQDLFQTPTTAPIPSKIAATWLTPSPTPQREELKSWVKKMMSTPSSTETQKKNKKDEGNPELPKDKKAKAIALPAPPPPPPPPLPSSSTPVAHRTRKHVSKPTSSKSAFGPEWITY